MSRQTPMYDTCVERLKVYMEKNEMTLREMGVRCGIAHTTIWYFMHRRVDKFSVKAAQRIVEPLFQNGQERDASIYALAGELALLKPGRIVVSD